MCRLARRAGIGQTAAFMARSLSVYEILMAEEAAMARCYADAAASLAHGACLGGTKCRNGGVARSGS
jgi:hypothetical protein